MIKKNVMNGKKFVFKYLLTKTHVTKRHVKKDGPTYKKIDLICRHNVVEEMLLI